MITKVETHHAPKATNFYSQAVIANGFVFVAGQLPMTADGILIAGTTEEKVACIMKNIKAILTEAGSSLSNVVKATVYVTDMLVMKEFNTAYATYFPDTPPAREAVCVKTLPLGASIEISVIAAI